VRQVLIERARKLREEPVPAGCCAQCFARHCRALYIGHCVCTGHIDLTRKDLFSRH
jgi:hypothetical protein